MHHSSNRLQLFCVTALVVLAGAGAARADGLEVKPEFWIGGGVSWPDYHDHSQAIARGGIGAIFAGHFTLGASAQGDRDHFHYFADGGVILPQVSFFVPYGRYQYGRRDDGGDNAWGWCAGIRMLGEGINLYLEANEILEPEFNKGLTFGVQF